MSRYQSNDNSEGSIQDLFASITLQIIRSEIMVSFPNNERTKDYLIHILFHNLPSDLKCMKAVKNEINKFCSEIGK